jgi:hypothetical protein
MPGPRIFTTGTVVCLLTATVVYGGMNWLDSKFDLKSRLLNPATSAAGAAPPAPAPSGNTPQLGAPSNPPSAGAKPAGVSSAPANLVQDLMAEYHNLPERGWDGTFPATDPALKQYVNSVYFDWGRSSPTARISNKQFAVRYMGYLKIEQPGVYTFRISHNKGARISLDQQIIFDQWKRPNRELIFDRTINQTGWLPFQIDYWARKGPASLKLEWATPNEGVLKLIPASHLAHQQ